MRDGAEWVLRCRWTVDVAGASETLYEGETFKLQFKFGSRYPFDSPEVTASGHR